jgi:hypothetical protein
VTPVGADSVSSCLALQAGLARLAALDELTPEAYRDDHAVELEATGASARDVTVGHLGVDRLTRMAAPALREVLSQRKPAPAASPEAIVLLQVVAPACRAGRDDRLEQLFARRLERLCVVPGGGLDCRFVYGGHTGALAAL